MNVYSELLKLGAVEVTTDRQRVNGTREFEFPVPCSFGNTMMGVPFVSQTKLRLASFSSGYIRRQNGCWTSYQLNRRNEDGTCVLVDSEDERAKMLYLYYLKYLKKVNKWKAYVETYNLNTITD